MCVEQQPLEVSVEYFFFYSMIGGVESIFLKLYKYQTQLYFNATDEKRPRRTHLRANS